MIAPTMMCASVICARSSRGGWSVFAEIKRFHEQDAMKSGNARPPDGHGMMFGAAMLFVITASIVAGLFIGVHFGK